MANKVVEKVDNLYSQGHYVPGKFKEMMEESDKASGSPNFVYDALARDYKAASDINARNQQMDVGEVKLNISIELLAKADSLSSTDYKKALETMIGSDQVDGKISKAEMGLLDDFVKQHGEAFGKLSADFNGDGKVNSKDLGDIPAPIIKMIAQTAISNGIG